MDQHSPNTLPGGRDSAAEPVLRSRLLPRVSFQSLLLLTTISAVIIAVVFAAGSGGIYAKAAAVGLTYAFGMFVCSSVVFLLLWAVSFLSRAAGMLAIALGVVLLVLRFTGVSLGPLDFLRHTIWLTSIPIIGWYLVQFPIGVQDESAPESPFAEGQLPPQILAPREPNH